MKSLFIIFSSEIDWQVKQHIIANNVQPQKFQKLKSFPLYKRTVLIISELTIFNSTKVFQKYNLWDNYHTFVSQLSPTIKSKNTIKMIQTVLKRDGRVVGFNEEKIATAIRKAMLHTDKG